MQQSDSLWKNKSYMNEEIYSYTKLSEIYDNNDDEKRQKNKSEKFKRNWRILWILLENPLKLVYFNTWVFKGFLYYRKTTGKPQLPESGCFLRAGGAEGSRKPDGSWNHGLRDGAATGGFLLQYEESGWEFLVRFAKGRCISEKDALGNETVI